MHKTVTIHIAGQLLHLEEAGYTRLRQYLDGLHAAFAGEEHGSEVVQDIEIRIAELLLERLSPAHQSVTADEVAEILAVLGEIPVAPTDSAPAPEAPPKRRKRRRRKFFRRPEAGLIAGVCSGLAVRYGVAAFLVRLLFVLMLPIFGAGLVLYLLLWATVPPATTRAQKLESQGEAVNLSNLSRMEENPMSYTSAGPGRWERILFAPFTFAGRLLRFLGRGLRTVLRYALIVASYAAHVFALGLLVALALEGLAFFELPRLDPTDQRLMMLSLYGGMGALFVGGFVWLLVRLRWVTPPRRNFWQPLGTTALVGLVIAGYYAVQLSFTLQTNAHTTAHHDLSVPNQTLIVAVNAPGASRRSDLSLYIRPDPEVTQPYLVLKKLAQGRHEYDALTQAEAIDYRFAVTDSVLFLDQHFALPEGALYHNQRIVAEVHVPDDYTLVLSNPWRQATYLQSAHGLERHYYYGRTPIRRFVALDGHLYALNPEERDRLDAVERSEVRQYARRLFRAYDPENEWYRSLPEPLRLSPNYLFPTTPAEVAQLIHGFQQLEEQPATAKTAVDDLTAFLVRKKTVLAHLDRLPPAAQYLGLQMPLRPTEPSHTVVIPTTAALR